MPKDTKGKKSNPFLQSITMQQTREWKILQQLNDLLWEEKYLDTLNSYEK